MVRFNDILDKINRVKEGDTVSFNVPLGNGRELKIDGTASIDSKGNVVIQSKDMNVEDSSISNGTITIERGKNVTYKTGINISIDGNIQNDSMNQPISFSNLNLNVKEKSVTIENAPYGINSGSYNLEFEEIPIEVEKPDTSGQKTGGSTGKTGVNKTANEAPQLMQYTAKSHDQYWNNDFQFILNNTSYDNYDNLAKDLKTSVNDLKSDFERVKGQINEWCGASSDAAQECINTILNKFQCTMDNIEGAIEPACEKIEDFKDKLEELKKGQEILTGAGGLDEQREIAEKDYQEKYNTYITESNVVVPKTIQVYDSEKQKTVNKDNTAKQREQAAKVAAAKAAMEEAEQKLKMLIEEITAQEEKLDTLLNEVFELYSMIKDVVQCISLFKDYLNDSSLSGANSLIDNFDKIMADLDSFTPNAIDYSFKSRPVLCDNDFFEKMYEAHADEGWTFENGVLTMKIGEKTCTYDINTHLFSDGGTYTDEKGNTKLTQLETFFYLPSHIVESGDYSSIKDLNVYTFFSADQTLNDGSNYKDSINTREINTFTMMVIKQDPLREKYDTVASITKMGNKIAGTDSKCSNIIGGDSVYGFHSLRIASQNGDLYDTVYCVDNAAIVTDQNGKAGTKEQFDSIEELKGLDNKNIYFINVSGDDNYSTGVEKVPDGDKYHITNAYVHLDKDKSVSYEELQTSFTYSGIKMVAEECPNSKIHIVYQCLGPDLKKYEVETFPQAFDDLADYYGNVWNDSKDWNDYAYKYYTSHSQGNYVPHDLASAESTINPNFSDKYEITSNKDMPFDDYISQKRNSTTMIG